MRTAIKLSLAIGIVLSFAACGGPQPATRLPAAMLQASSGDEVQFVTENHPAAIAEFDYSKGTSPIRQWRIKPGSVPLAACTGGSKTFWVVLNKANQIVEYATDKEKPIARLSVSLDKPADCAVDPSTGDVAVTVGASGVTIFANGSGSGRTMSDGLSFSRSLTYDSRGNLFITGDLHSEDNPLSLAELPKGSAGFKLLRLSNKVRYIDGGALRWDGTYLALHVTGYVNDIYRYRAAGKVAKLEGTVIGIATDCGDFWFSSQAGLLFCPVWTDGGYVLVYDYPAGSSPVAKLGPVSDYQSGIVSLSP